MLSLWILSLILAVLSMGVILCMGAIVSRRLGYPADETRSVIIAVVYGVLGLALIGTAVAATPLGKRIVAAVLLLAILAALVGERRHFGWYRAFARSARGPVAAWFVATIVALAVTFVPAKQPPALFDGPYVFKRWVLPVQIQALTGHFPADNSLPAVVTEFLARGISFADVRPIMPGQEVSNRPILVGLAALPARVLLGGPREAPNPMPRFDYVGTSWPDTLGLVSDYDFRLFLALAVPLNALVAVVFYALLVHFDIRRRLATTLVVCALSPYVLFHTVFTWPKNLAAFFLLAGIMAMFCGPRMPWLAGAALGLAYWSHPYALAFIGVFCAYALWQVAVLGQRGEALRSYGVSALVAIGAVALWFAWTQLILRIPSDLVVQNQASGLSALDVVWVRLKNLYTTLAPIALDVFPFQAPAVLTRHMVTVWAALGFLMLFIVAGYGRPMEPAIRPMTAIGLLGGMAVIFIFGVPAAPMLHGWQAVWPVLALPALVWLGGRDTPGFALEAVLVVQLALNVGVVLAWGRTFAAI